MAGLLDYEIERLRFRHFWLIPGILFFSLYVFAVPQLILPLFFYLRSTLSPTGLSVASLCIVHHISFISHCVVVYAITCLKWPVFEQYRLGKTWPTELFSKAMKTLLINFVLLIPMFQYISYKCNLLTSRIDDNLPSPKEIASQIVICMITEEIWSYSTHRLMHTPFFYSRIHKKHHEYKGSISYSAEYAHPIEFIGVNVIAAGTGAMILGSRMHIVTFLTWICYRIGDTIDQHCGYDFPWNPYSIMPFATSAQYHDFHHTNNNGNYSSGFVCLDYWLGTERMKNKKKNE